MRNPYASSHVTNVIDAAIEEFNEATGFVLGDFNIRDVNVAGVKDIKYAISPDARGNEDLYKQGTWNALMAVHRLYMRPLRTKTVADDLFVDPSDINEEDLPQYGRKISKLTRRLKKFNLRSGGWTAIMLKNDRGTAYLNVGKDDDPSNENNFPASLIVNTDNMTIVYLLCITADKRGSASVRLLTYTPYFIATTPSVVRKKLVSHEHQYLSIMLFCMGCAKVFTEALEFFVESFGNDNIEPSHPNYSSLEMRAFKSVAKMVSGGKPDSYPVGTWETSDTVNLDIDARFKKVLDVDTPEFIKWEYDYKQAPLVDLTKKEWDYIDKYPIRKKLIDTRFDIRQYLAEPRWGDTYRLRLGIASVESKDAIPDDLDVKDTDLMFSLKMDADSNVMRVYISEDLNPDTKAIVSVGFYDLDQFDYVESLCHVRQDIIYKTTDKMVSSIDELRRMSALLSLDPQEAISMARRLIDFFIVLHDRPQRTRMIKCTEERTKQLSKKQIGRGEDPKEYVISRILKPTKEAKEFVDKMTEVVRRTGSRRPAEYTLESWDRIGHWRTYKKTGRKIWIEETTCERHMKLSDKELHVKL